MRYYNFSRLINKYTTKFVLITHSENKYDDSGIFVKGRKIEQEMQGAIINYSESKIYRSEGRITEQDKQLFMLYPIEKSLKDASVIHDGKTYSISEEEENYLFTGVYAYRLKYVSPFGGVEND